MSVQTYQCPVCGGELQFAREWGSGGIAEKTRYECTTCNADLTVDLKRRAELIVEEDAT